MTTSDSGAVVHLTVAHGVATITLDSPANRNALSNQLRAELAESIENALRDDSVRLLVLTHAGPVFCAGADLKEARDAAASPAGFELAGLLTAVMTADKPVIARVAGPARAGGIGLVAACDLVVATEAATFAFSEVRIGVVPAIISVPLRGRVAPQALRELFLTGNYFDAKHAAQIGLVDTVTSEADLDDAIDTLAATLKLASPNALNGAKKLLGPNRRDLAEEMAQMQQLTAHYFSSEDGQEGIRAFGEKRLPSWASSLQT
ncbi:methylglutaconyl-CoA hydratase [Williamsia limnetica]|uniref:Methylglutaconyl-CoA hydratase n=1 Tax=Williamsia limnetica TaxID=882452 RepID=A0A318RGP0_WILLI|nr:enoyl-CoA hydratase-related protein [Williamsia limnetica]PYE15991.1 methylglutaconyl-CoA hydratase [Williamsia limnetica]